MIDWNPITSAVEQALRGEHEAAEALLRCWEGTTEADAAPRCVIAHYLADLQTSLDEEVAWDEAALRAFADVDDGDLAPLGIASAEGLAPSLHLNLGDGYLRQGRPEQAREQLAMARQSEHLLPAEGYGGLIRSGLARLEDRVSAALAEGPGNGHPAGHDDGGVPAG